jgi:hypothetical protein
VARVSSCQLLGKGFADFIRDRVVDVPVGFLEEVERGEVEGRVGMGLGWKL